MNSWAESLSDSESVLLSIAVSTNVFTAVTSTLVARKVIDAGQMVAWVIPVGMKHVTTLHRQQYVQDC